jgi:uncharacterized membrane protein YphA (DoxX/SURF4 family)
MRGTFRIGHVSYSAALIVYGVQQLVYGNFRNVQLPAWQSHLPALSVWAYVTGVALIAGGVAIILKKNPRSVCLVLGAVFLFLFLFVHIPFEIFGEVNSSLHLALWVDALKELALAGGAFVMAATFPEDGLMKRRPILLTFESFVPFRHIFFCVPLICFGFTHFMYADHVATLVPEWFPDRTFWTYFSATALIASGIAIILKIREGVIAFLLSAMLFLWIILLHIPRAVTDPTVARGNEIASVFDALAFCGTAWVISLEKLKSDVDAMFR